MPLVLGTVWLVPLAGWSHLALDPAVPKIGYWTYVTQYFLAHGPKPDFWPRESAGRRSISAISGFSSICWSMRCCMPGARIRAAGSRQAAAAPPSQPVIAAYAVLLAAATFVIRIWYPQNHWIGFLGFIQMEPAHMPQYPACS